MTTRIVTIRVPLETKTDVTVLNHLAITTLDPVNATVSPEQSLNVTAAIPTVNVEVQASEVRLV